ncbi:protein of unknown function DUF1555 [Geobacter metallireducens RCH3]|uniref:PEP motif-containing protein, exosortase substrate n=1 Tax=Geobacter metallireducens (strain ATCC 53774 / DSM 7210 / GS-15) TaxID=269799 RepID=Q39VP0_GEOMG|nr:PEP-CTERM sorting domain-containing protein [Geobacter metallireducens]ABB31684.1 hypothetical protein Gmet_1450 [Geobacter metallireducens GS-15]EHP89440.1 protein of unknown function DUF1555 [Geobacter metallireducens RCH3]
MKTITATIAAALLLGLAGNALAAYTDFSSSADVKLPGLNQSLSGGNAILTVINPIEDRKDKGIITVIAPAEKTGIVTVVEPMDFTFTQLSYSQGFFFDTSDTFGAGGSRMATIGSSSIRSMSAFFTQQPLPPIITEVAPSGPGIVTVITPANATTVPVPPALFLMGSGLAGLAGIRRKRQS